MIMTKNTVADVRNWFKELKDRGEYVTDKTGCKMLEVVGATFIADEEAIFGIVNRSYVQRELDWYKMQSCVVHDIPGGPPKEWLRCAGSHGLINSNYGYLIWNEKNGLQYHNVLNELRTNPFSRRAVMIYTRPTMWTDYNAAGMSDFVCTNAVQYFVRDNKLTALVQMRSNDVIFGYKNDKFWQDYVHRQLADDLKCEVGPLVWHAGSLHVYERHFDLIGDKA